ncbi:hypothetical protein [Nonomuraea indica]|uniref:hypothetical protein n=1 Tax=Nonomuraea indica TaxID=1581193 RepID=UPI0015DE9BB0|nr:hypothetical protein [Nonomuraea indica]
MCIVQELFHLIEGDTPLVITQSPATSGLIFLAALFEENRHSLLAAVLPDAEHAK